MPNSFAYLALFSWPLVVFVLFRVKGRSEALIWSIIGGYLLLPFGVGINPPVLPTIDKTLVPSLCAGLMCLAGVGKSNMPLRRSHKPEHLARSAPRDDSETAFTRQQTRRPVRTAPEHATPVEDSKGQMQRLPLIIWLLLLLLMVTQVLTYLQNTADYSVGRRVMPGLGLYDASSLILNSLVMLLPFALGHRYLGASTSQTSLLRILTVAGLLYSLPILFEIRMSPQLSRWTYGFLAQNFLMAMRGDGFRPIVFLQSGLVLAIFVAMTALAGFAFWRSEKALGRRGIGLFAGLWMSGVMFLSNSLGALGILIMLAPLCLLLSARSQVAIAALIALTILTYPLLRGAGIAPVGMVYDIAASISEERAQSFQFRIDNEDLLLAHANEQPVAGWGGYGRSRVYDPQTGEDISVTDGMWIILLGVSGWAGYIAVFGLLAAPPVILMLRFKRLEPSLATAGLCMVLAANMIDMIPNATLTPITWLVAGALAGRTRHETSPVSDSQVPLERSSGTQKPIRRSGPAIRR